MTIALANFILLLSAAALNSAEDHPTAVRSQNEDVLRPRIVGGNVSLLGDFAYQVSIEVGFPGGEYMHYCGGSIIAPSKVVTTARCVFYWYQGYEFRVVAGDVDRAETNGYEQYRNVCSVATHPKYKLGSEDYNYAVVGLCSSFEFNAYVGAVPLASTEPAAGYCQSSGWGVVRGSDDTIYPTTSLQNVSLSLVPKSDCAKEYERLGVDITDRLVCAGGSGKGICNGDYGGGLVCEDGTLVGVATFNKRPCGDAPGLFASIPPARRWIDSQEF